MLKVLPLLLLPFALANSFAQTKPATAPSPVPIGLTMTANSPTSITLGWLKPKSDDATGYTLYSGTSAEGPFSQVKSLRDRTITLEGLNPGTTYFYRVSATNPNGESPQSPTLAAFTIAPWQPAPFPVKLAKNMCVSLDGEVVCQAKPLTGTLKNLVDGSDTTGCRLRKDADIRIKLDPNLSIADADYLLVHFRADCGAHEWSNDKLNRTLRAYTIIGSSDSTDGKNGTWQELASGTNEHLDSVIKIPNQKQKWIGIQSSYAGSKEVPKADDRRLHPNDLILCRLDVFRSAPAGFRNDLWVFTGDSLVVQDMPGGTFPGRKDFFSDLIRKQHPDRYPMVVHAARGGEMMKDTLPRTEKVLAALSPDSANPIATVVCWESGYNDVGVGGSLGTGQGKIKSYEAAMEMCKSKGAILVPARIQFSLQYLNPQTLEPAQGNVYVNSLAVNLGGADVFARTHTPYAVDPKTNLPYADYWSYIRQTHATSLVKDGVHHTPEGADGINRLWANAADKMVYGPQSSPARQ